MPEEKPQYPDLRTKEGAQNFLRYHAPDEEARVKHEYVNHFFQSLINNIWEHLPDGPGKTIFIRKLNDARMAANSCIANNGA